ncbi:hypothetical protein AWB68_03289 [Caballeronia choica]|uniref:DUF2933 domain-containing protein n=1 Tax=Caballeronia choica TaxID=326476 RepID=A0A158J0Y1_9BURK|nr:DUF2933 domain-containing protein [Caballeronia choica]SAL62395.1 hypothetical protein AWB68_03289 [Caballeronia choica]
MKCNTKTMVAMGLAFGLILALGYWALPQFRGSLTSLILVACSLVCPLSMLFMMRGIQSGADKPDARDETVRGQKS